MVKCITYYREAAYFFYIIVIYLSVSLFKEKFEHTKRSIQGLYGFAFSRKIKQDDLSRNKYIRKQGALYSGVANKMRNHSLKFMRRIKEE